MTKFFLQMLNARDPKVSSARFLSIITVLLVLYVWAWVCLYTRTIQNIPMGVIYFVGVVVAGKTVQSFSESEFIKK
jgi:hypothetical protein